MTNSTQSPIKSTQTLTPADVVARYLPDTLTPVSSATVFAPSNIALCKYWGKRDSALNLPINASLSISLGNLGTTTTLRPSETGCDSLTLNGKVLSDSDKFFTKVFAFIDLFRRAQPLPIAVETVNNIPTAAGLASSASGFGALMLAINEFFQLNLPNRVLSAFARMGSGSASRSLYHGFVEWHKGEQADGMDSFAEPIDSGVWSDFRVGVIEISAAEKKIQSREGMNRTVSTSWLYPRWEAQAQHDFDALRNAIVARDFERLGEVAEHNAMSMHATMISSWPPIVYWQPESVAAMHAVWALRERGIPVYFTMDAGPNVKVLFLAEHEKAIVEALRVDGLAMLVVAPFATHTINSTR